MRSRRHQIALQVLVTPHAWIVLTLAPAIVLWAYGVTVLLAPLLPIGLLIALLLLGIVIRPDWRRGILDWLVTPTRAHTIHAGGLVVLGGGGALFVVSVPLQLLDGRLPWVAFGFTGFVISLVVGLIVRKIPGLPALLVALLLRTAQRDWTVAHAAAAVVHPSGIIRWMGRRWCRRRCQAMRIEDLALALVEDPPAVRPFAAQELLKRG